MATGYLIDTNVLIDVQMNRLPLKGSQFLASVIDDDFTISFITYIEFLGYKDISKTTEDFMALANVIGIDKDIINICIALRKRNLSNYLTLLLPRQLYLVIST